MTLVHLRPGGPAFTRQRALPPGQWVDYYGGFGGWDDSVIYRVVRRGYTRWEVVRASDTLRLPGKALAEFLSRCPRKGYLQSKLVIDLR